MSAFDARGVPLRLGDAERDQAAAALGEHFAHGRLTDAEYHDRVDRAYAARTHDQLAPLFHDLPGGVPVPAPLAAPPTASRSRGRSWPGRPGGSGRALIRLLLLVALVLLVISHLPLIVVALVLGWLLVRSRTGCGRRRLRLG